MSNFDSTKRSLKELLNQIVVGKIQLPDFQRGWVWDDEHIRSLLISIARDFPIGSIMLLETGGDAKFQIRSVEGVDLSTIQSKVEHLILDGQQRLTSLVQVLKLTTPVRTRDAQKREVERYYYIDIEQALAGGNNLEEAFIGLDASRILRRNFGREVALDLSSQEKEFTEFYFPCNQILNSDVWEDGLIKMQDQQRFSRYMEFRRVVLNRFREYDVPVIDLKKENSKEAVCLVFEKVNTGGVALSVFELVTASYAADGFNLRDDWFGSDKRSIPSRQKKVVVKPLLSTLEPTDFLQGIALLHTYDRRQQDIQAGKSGKDITAVSAKREQILSLPLTAYQTWADKLTSGFLEVDKFLRMEGFRKRDYLPYQSQLIPLAAVMVHLGNRWMEPVIRDKVATWFWNGVFGELYGGAIETRIALDMQDVLAWTLGSSNQEPTTVIAAGFQPSRLDTLRTRTSAAYRGLYVLLQREGAKDFFWKAKMIDLDHDDINIDIHHIFPKKWCKQSGISPRVMNSIINKTPISYKANRKIGGKAPSQYLEDLQREAAITHTEQDSILASHLIDTMYLQNDDFESFYQARKQNLIVLIEQVMCKTMQTNTYDQPIDDTSDDDELTDE